MKPLTISGHLRPVNQIKFNRDSDLMFTGGSDKKIMVWVTETGERIGTFSQEGAISCLCISNDSKILISGDTLGNVYIWDIYAGKCIRSYISNNNKQLGLVSSIDISYGDKEVIIVSSERGVNK